jgi:hypothetical protein
VSPAVADAKRSEPDVYLMLVEQTLDTPGPAGAWSVSVDPDGLWVSARPANAPSLPVQGWKLHVSAGMSSAVEVLERALQVLGADSATFKVARSPAHLKALNTAQGGLSQIGKFITVYPSDDAHAVRLAAALHEATAGLRGPRIPSDRPYAVDGLVHYRYGSFANRYAQLPTGEVAPVIESPDGSFVPDTRRLDGPEWVEDPFESPAPEPRSSAVGGRFVLLSTAVGSARGGVFLAVDLDGPRRCIVKQARRDALLTFSGTDARDRLRWEADVLRRLGPGGPWPDFLGLVEEGDSLFLAQEEIPGELLSVRLAHETARGCHLAADLAAAWMATLAQAVARIHAHGLVVRDLKTSNVAFDGDNNLRLIDLECAEIGGETPHGSLATRGYASPEQRAGGAPTIGDDIFGLGALLWCFLTGAEPSFAPDPTNLLERPVEILNPAPDERLVAIAERCLATRAEDRYLSADVLAADLDAVTRTPDSIATASTVPTVDRADPREWLDLARAVGRCVIARGRRSDNEAMTWTAITPRMPYVLDIATGDAGVVLALAVLGGATGDGEVLAAVADGARSLRDVPRLAEQPLAGLYIGECGVAVAMLAAGCVCGDPGLVDVASARAAAAAALPWGPTELINGSAGRARAMLWFHAVTGDAAFLRHAAAAGDHIVSEAEHVADGTTWTMAEGFRALSGKVHLGYAHGTAGIADVLLDLFEATGDERYRDAAGGAARWLAARAIGALADGSGVTWPDVEGKPDSLIAWCNGSAGVGTFLMHASAHDLLPEADDLVRRAATAVAIGTRTYGAGQCHGLSGSIGFLLDAARWSGDESFVDHAGTIGTLLRTFVPPVRLADDLSLMTISKPFDAMSEPSTLAIGYLEGLAGVLVAIVRLAEPHRALDPLGAQWTFAN